MSNDVAGTRFSRAILHVDGDAFFAACEQALHPEWRGKPVVTGAERGIVSAASYEAKAFGVSRGVSLKEARRMCPEAIFVSSDLEVYARFSRRLYAIMRRYAPVVEEYSIDEAFADITGMDVPMRCSYAEIGRRVQGAVRRELGITVSVGLAPTKTLAKVASKWKKPEGLTVIAASDTERFLRVLPVGRVWGIGPKSSMRCAQYNVRTAWDLVEKPRGWVTTYFDGPMVETWMELRGEPVSPVSGEGRAAKTSVQQTRTFMPPSAEKEFVFSQLLKNLEGACARVRKQGSAARGASIFLKTQEFRYASAEVSFTRATAYPHEMTAALRKSFEKIFVARTSYRATGITLIGLTSASTVQLDMFEGAAKPDAMRRVYAAVDAVAEKFGKGSVRLAGSAARHEGERAPSGTSRLPNGKAGKAATVVMAALRAPKTMLRIPVLGFEVS